MLCVTRFIVLPYQFNTIARFLSEDPREQASILASPSAVSCLEHLIETRVEHC